MTALTLTDEHLPITQRQSRLWVSSCDIPQPATAPTVINRPSASETQKSFEAIIAESFRGRETSQQRSKPNLPHPGTPPTTPPAKPANAWVTRSRKVIEAVEVQARSIAEKVAFCNGLPDDTLLREILDDAAKDVESAGKSLQPIGSKDEGVLDYKTQVLEELRSIDNRISLLGASLSPLPMKRTRVHVEAGL